MKQTLLLLSLVLVFHHSPKHSQADPIPASYLATVRGSGTDWADCMWDLGRRLLNETPYRHLVLDSVVSRFYYFGWGRWYTIRATDANNVHYDFLFTAVHDGEAGNCRIGFYSEPLWSSSTSAILRDSEGNMIFTLTRNSRYPDGRLRYVCEYNPQ